MPLASGTRLGPYEIVERLGAGGMGEVYRARDTRLERTVAIKVLPQQFSSDPGHKQRLEGTRERRFITMIKARLMYAVLLAAICLGSAHAQSLKYPPIEEYLMPQANEIALAKSAAPANISERATIKVLTRSGYEVTQKGDNGSVCMVMRGFAAPTYTPAPFRNLVYDPTVR